MTTLRSHGRPFSATYDRTKLENAILFFIKHANNGHLGKTKLMKLLYYADFDHAEQFGTPITGARYCKLPQGPVPEEAAGVLTVLAETGRIAVESNTSGPYPQFRYEALTVPNMDVFGATERSVLAKVVNRWRNSPLSTIVAATHNEAPWLSVRMGEEIPYHMAGYRRSLSTAAQGGI